MERGTCHEFPGIPAIGDRLEASAGGLEFVDLAVAEGEEIPSVDGLLIVGEGAEEAVEFVGRETVVLGAFLCVLGLGGGVVVEGGEIEDVAGGFYFEGIDGFNLRWCWLNFLGWKEGGEEQDDEKGLHEE